MEKNFMTRTMLLIGSEGVDALQKSKVIIFGVGGVGSFAAEALARVGVGNMVLVDYDTVDITNINRQIQALHSTVDLNKVQVMEKRIKDINPNINIKVYNELYSKENSDRLLNDNYDYVVDAIDMVTSKLDLIVNCKERNFNVISCMGMGNKLDPTKIEISDISKTHMCPLAKVMRKELKVRGINKLKVVFSSEKPLKPKICISNESKREVPGSISFVPSTAGLILASAVVNDILDKLK